MQVQSLMMVFVAMLVFSPLAAQRDTNFVNVRTEQGELVQQNFVDEYDFVFLNKEPLRFMAKWNAAAALPLINTDWQTLGGSEGGSLRPEVALEVKIAPSLSVNGLLAADIAGEGGSVFESLIFGIEPRFYVNQKRRVRSGKSANNLTGTYLSASFLETVEVMKPSFWPEGFSYRHSNYSATARIGFQHRIFRNGYIDFSWGLGAATRTHITVTSTDATFDKTWRAAFDQRLTMGWAFGSPRSTRQENRSCDLFKCFREENHLFKIDVLNLVRQINTDRQSGKLNLAFEQKIKSSPFSVQVEASGLFGRSSIKDFKQTAYGYGTSVEPRFYHNLKKRIARGKSGNNLNGMFVGLNMGYSTSWNLENYSTFHPTYIERSTRAVPVWGVQYRIFDKGFFEWRMGAGLGRYVNDIEYRKLDFPIENPPTQRGYEMIFLSELKIGFAF